MPLRPVVSYLLAQLDFLKFPNHGRRQNERDQKGRDGGVNDAEALIAEHIQEGKFRVERI